MAVINQSALDVIRKDIDQGMINVGTTAGPQTIETTYNFTRTAPVVAPIAGTFTEDYVNSTNSNFSPSDNSFKTESGTLPLISSLNSPPDKPLRIHIVILL